MHTLLRGQVASTPVHPPGPIGYYDKDGRHGVLAVVPPVGGRAESQFHASKFTILRPDGSTYGNVLCGTDMDSSANVDDVQSPKEMKRVRRWLVGVCVNFVCEFVVSAARMDCWLTRAVFCIDRGGGQVKVPLRYGNPFILMDQNGLVWNNRVSTSIK